MSEKAYTEENTPAQQPAHLSLNDLKLCVQIIDVCSSRGAFKPEEFGAVGAIHQKLTLFLAQSEQAQQAAQQNAQATPEETNDD